MSTVHPAQSGASEVEAVRDRRTVLRGAAAVGLAGAAAPLLAGCGDDGGAGSTPSSAPGTTSAPTTAPTSAPTSAPSSSAPGGGGPVLGPKSEVPVGGGKVYQDARIVVTQPKAGEYKGFSAVCTHNNCIVRDVADGSINCGCHGSKFAIADGARTAGPASSPLPPANVTVQGNNILGPAS